MTRPLLVVSVAFAAGTLLGAASSRGAAWLLVALAAALLGLCLVRPDGRAATAGLLAAAVAAGAADAAAERAAWDERPLGQWLAGQPADVPVRLVGRVTRADRDEESWRLTLDVQEVEAAGRSRPLRGTARLDVGGTAARPDLAEGDRIAAWTTLRPPTGYHDPGVPDRADQAQREGLDALGYVKSAWLVRSEGPAASWLVRPAAGMRRWCRRTLERAVLPGPERGVVLAMVLGDRSGVDRDTAEEFRMAGTYHVLALSGAQVALLAGVLLAALRPWRPPPFVLAIVVSSALLFYAAFVGGDVPITRAAVMGMVLLFGRSLDLDADVANLLGLAGGLLLAHRPSTLGDLAFQLSFGATLGLVLLTARVGQGWPELPLRAELAVAGSVAAQLALAPLLLVHFHRLAPAAVVLNLVAVPLSGAVMLFGLACALVAPVSAALGRLLADLAWMSAHVLLLSGRVMRWLPALDLRFPTPPVWAVGLHLAALLDLAGGRHRRRAWVLLGLGLLALLWARSPVADGRLALTVLDVGQGDCLVLRSPRGRVWLVDTGGAFDSRFDVGEAVVGPYLWHEGVRRVQGLVLTHAHPDHVGGAPFLLRSFAPVDVWEGIAPRRDNAYDALDAVLRRAAVRRRSVGQGVVADWDGVRVEVVGPGGGPPPWRTRNDDSVVLLLQWGAVRLLLTGDVEAAGETRLAGIRADLLKVPHHGSRSSSTPGLVNSSLATAAVVSVGAGNRFGHPSPEVLRRYDAAGIRVFRTDRDGAITLATDGRQVWARTFRDGREERLHAWQTP